jgi:uncharacterized SAM-binding protein YcdF (DUF218 family)
LLILLEYAPHYLTYADIPVESDAIVLFVGADNRARQEGANLLITQGYARYFLIPAYGKISEVSSAPSHADTKAHPKPIISNLKTKSYFENTHVEVIEAKRIMEQYGLKSAIFVSSPDHMRRIKIITEKVFDKSETRIAFVPTRAVPVYHGLLNQTLSDFESMGRECIKIAWFLIYSTFQPQT